MAFIYDADCRMCSAFARSMSGAGVECRTADGRAGSMDAAEWREPDGTVRRGHRAVARALREAGGLRAVAGTLVEWGPLSALASLLYPVVARHRHRL